jgi:hypothetical protein
MSASIVSYDAPSSAPVGTRRRAVPPPQGRSLVAVRDDGTHDRLEALLRELAAQADAWQLQLAAATNGEPPLHAGEGVPRISRGEREIKATLRGLVSSATTSLAWSRSADDHTRWGGIGAVSRSTCESLAVNLVIGCSAAGLAPALAHFAEAEGNGAQIRAIALADLPCECLVVDGKVGCVATNDATGEPILHETRELSVVRTLASSFALAWRAGSPLAQLAALAGEGDAEMKREIVRLLADGAKDETIARSVGVSLRTCRRHVAEILSLVSATSRFQAGFVLARTIGALDSIHAG